MKRWVKLQQKASEMGLLTEEQMDCLRTLGVELPKRQEKPSSDVVPTSKVAIPEVQPAILAA